MNQLALFTSPQLLAFVTFFNALVLLVVFILTIQNRTTIHRMNDKFHVISSELEKKSAQQILEQCLEDTTDLKAKFANTENKINYLERNFLQSVQKVGILRYNAFENVGSDLSFAIALLDSYDNGIVLSGIYSRDSSQTYAKPIISGNSKYTLSAEEIQAISIAKKNYGERLYTDK